MGLYLWVKAAHIVSIIAWMAALLYLPRLYVYHAEVDPKSELAETFKVMERRLLRFIANPAMIAAWVFGLWLVFGYVGWTAGWLHAKFAFVAALTVYHHYLASWRKAFAEDRNIRSPRFYRVANEVPTVLMIAIVVLAVVKPF